MKFFYNVRKDFLWVIPTIGIGFADTRWVSVSWLGLEFGVTQ
jgi:hypothetical protein